MAWTRVLNRGIEWGAHRIAAKADAKHADMLAQAHAGTGGRGLTPCVRSPGQGAVDVAKSPEVNGASASEQRADVARINSLSAGRPDLQYIAKEATRHMARPREADETRITRIPKCEDDITRMVQLFR